MCLNSTDCNDDPLEYCNFDKDQMGFCEKCSSILRDCVGENLFCYNGEKSCNETCGCKKKLCVTIFNSYYFIVIQIVFLYQYSKSYL